MKVCFIIGRFYPPWTEGTRNFLKNLIQTNDFKGSFIITNKSGKKANIDGVTVIEEKFDVFNFNKIKKRIMDEVKPDLMCVLTSSPNMAFYFSLLKIPKVWIVPSNRVNTFYKKLLSKLCKYNKIITTSTSLQKELSFIKSEKINIGIKVSSTKSKNSKNKIPIIGYIGSTGKERGLPILLKTLHNLKKDGLKFRFYLAAHTKRYLPFENKDEIIKDETKTFGLLKNKVDFLNSCDILVNPLISSKGVTSPPLFTLESMSKSKIVCASRIAVHEEVIKDQKNGFLFELNEDSLYKLLKSLIVNKLKYNLNTIRKNANKTILENYDIKKISKKYVKLFEDVLRE